MNSIKAETLFSINIFLSDCCVANIDKKRAFISVTGTTVAFSIELSRSLVIQRLIYLDKTTVILPYTKVPISVYNHSLLLTRDFLFKPDSDLEILLYTYNINVLTIFVLVYNNNKRLIYFTRNYRFSKISELIFLNTFYTNNDGVRDLAINARKFTYNISWFNKVIGAYVVTYTVAVAIKSVKILATIDILFK